jgi:hypothetical protein
MPRRMAIPILFMLNGEFEGRGSGQGGAVGARRDLACSEEERQGLKISV